jgi:hypothetical protein
MSLIIEGLAKDLGEVVAPNGIVPPNSTNTPPDGYTLGDFLRVTSDKWEGVGTIKFGDILYCNFRGKINNALKYSRVNTNGKVLRFSIGNKWGEIPEAKLHEAFLWGYVELLKPGTDLKKLVESIDVDLLKDMLSLYGLDKDIGLSLNKMVKEVKSDKTVYVNLINDGKRVSNNKILRLISNLKVKGYDITQAERYVNDDNTTILSVNSRRKVQLSVYSPF